MAGVEKSDNSGKQIGPLTTYRFFAALLVVICHNALVWENSSFPVLRDLKANGGKYGISFFFILSGFILTHRYQFGVENKLKYARARFARIVPLYWFCLVLSVISFFVSSKLSGQSFPDTSVVSDFLWKSSFLQTLYPPVNANFPVLQQGWTLSVEMLFYALFPFLLQRFSSASPSFRIGIILATVLTHSVFTYIQWSLTEFESTLFHFMAWFPIVHFPLFLLGMSLRLDTEFWNKVFRHWASKLASLLFVCLFLFRGVDVHSPFEVQIVFWLVAHAIVGSLENRSKILNGPVLQFLGNASYALYLCHGLAAAVTPFVLKKLRFQSELVGYPYFLGSSIIAVLASAVLYLLIEQPARKWINGHKKSPA